MPATAAGGGDDKDPPENWGPGLSGRVQIKGLMGIPGGLAELRMMAGIFVRCYMGSPTGWNRQDPRPMHDYVFLFTSQKNTIPGHNVALGTVWEIPTITNLD
jgi:hypothetical protein